MMRLERALLDAPDLAAFLTLVGRIRRALVDQPDEVRALIQRLRLPAIEAQLSAAARQALAAGLEDGLGILDEAGRPVRRQVDPPEALPASVAGLVAGLNAAGRTALGQALRLTRGDGIDPQAIAAPVLGYERRVRGTISDTITTAAAEGEVLAAEVAQVPLVWVAETTACVHCLAYSGVVVNPGDDFPEGLSYGRRPQPGSPGRTPPRHPNCLPWDTDVTPGSRVTGASARIYDGEMVRIETLSKQKLSGTPNHPVLTRRGWVGLGDLVPGDEVVSRRFGNGRVIRRDDDEYMPAKIGELAQATLGALEVAASEVPVSSVHFHGDGGGSDVAVVASERFLRDDFEATLCAKHKKALFGGAAGLPQGFSRRGNFRAMLFGLLLAAHRIVRGFGPLLALLRRSLRHAQRLSVAAPTALDSPLFEPGVYDSSGDAEAIRDAENTLAGQVFFDKVVDVERYAFHGEVYNLETERGWYIANNIVTHNCRCEVEPLRSQEYADALRREADRSVLRGFSLESESMKTRIEAAEDLLDRDPDAPRSVIEFARDAVDEGRFPTRGRPQ